MRRVDVDRVNTRNVFPSFAFEAQGVQEASLVEIETKYLGAGRSKEGIAGGEVVRQGAAKGRDAGPVVEAALGVQFEGAVVLKVDGFGPVI